VLRAGAIQKARYGSAHEIRQKTGQLDLVTEVDRMCEDAILETLRERTPDADIVTEETPLERKGARVTWYVDPLDGTTNYAHGYPCFCASVAAAKDGVVVAGAVYEPLREELYSAERGAGAHLNGSRLAVSTTTELVKALLITGFPYDLHGKVAERLRFFNALVSHARAIRRDGAAAIDLCLVAAGRADGFFEEVLAPWDVQAGGLVVEEAGGKLTRFDGAPVGLEGGQVLAANAALHQAMMGVLRGAALG
jgi:myo-inositol-1(or 4)-monophosphatase